MSLSPPFFCIHLPCVNAVKYSSNLYMIQRPTRQHSFAFCAQTTTIQFLLLDFLFILSIDVYMITFVNIQAQVSSFEGCGTMSQDDGCLM